MNTTSKNHDYTIQYSLLPFFYWAAFGSIISYASYYLLSLGYKNSTIGMIIAIAGVFAAILQPIVASYADRADSISLKNIVLIITGMQIAGYIVLFTIHRKVFLLSGVIYAFEIGLHQITTPLINSLGTETLNQGKKLNYGAARAVGSIGYAIAAFLLGQITTKNDSAALLLFAMFLLCLLEFFIFVFPFRKQVKTASASGAVNEKGASGLAFFTHYKKFTFLLIGCVLIYLSHILINNFTLQVLQTKGGGTAEMGTAQAIASIIELPVMFLFGWMLKKAPASVWFKISGLFFFLKIFATLLVPNVTLFYLIQSFQMFGWALISVSSVYYVNSIMEEKDKIKGQAYFTMTYTIGCVFGSLIGGALLESFGANAMLIFGSICSFVGAIIIFITA